MNENLNIDTIYCNFRLVELWNPTSVRPHWRIYWNPTLGARVDFANKSYYPDANHIIAIPPGVAVKQVMESAFETFYIHVAIGFPYHTYPDVVYFELGDETKALLQKIVTQYQRQAEFNSWSFHNKNLVNALIYRVTWELEEEKLSGQHISSSTRQSLVALDKSVVAGVTNNELAKVAGLSLSAFLARFTREVGCAPQQYLRTKRLEKAAHLLNCTDDTIEHIAAQCGFCERSYLSRLFKREFNIPPVEYRKRVEF